MGGGGKSVGNGAGMGGFSVNAGNGPDLPARTQRDSGFPIREVHWWHLI